jgi:hypothetical protein
MKLRLISVSAVTVLGLALSNGAQAWTVVRAGYAVPVVVYAPPPPRPVYYYVPARPTYVVPVVQVAPVPMTVAAPAPTIYVPAPAPNLTYAQPLVAVPVAGMH